VKRAIAYMELRASKGPFPAVHAIHTASKRRKEKVQQLTLNLSEGIKRKRDVVRKKRQ